MKENHISLPPPPRQPQDQSQVKRGPRLKGRPVRRNSGITGVRTPVAPKGVAGAVESSPNVNRSRRKPASVSRARVPTAAPLSTVHALSD